MSTGANTSAKPAQPAPLTGAIVLDLGKKTEKQVKLLRKGKGKLLDRVAEMISELQTKGAVARDTKPVIVIVEKKSEWGF